MGKESEQEMKEDDVRIEVKTERWKAKEVNKGECERRRMMRRGR